MDPVRTAWMQTVYRGVDPDVGDLWCHRPRVGHVMMVFEPTAQELATLNAGGRVLLQVLTEPLPPVSVSVLEAGESQPVAPHPFKVIDELNDPERG